MTDVKARQEEQNKLDINSLNAVAREITSNIDQEVKGQGQIKTSEDFEKQLKINFEKFLSKYYKN